jgi:hypothetical protein
MHDVGKCLAPARAGYRVLVTLLETIAPRLLLVLGGRVPALGALIGHAESGARMAADEGLPAGVVRLIAEHHQPALDERMAALQRADSLH